MIKKLNLIPLIFFLLISTSCKNIRIQDGERIEIKKGDFWLTPGNIDHGIEAGENGAKVMGIFSPPRDQYKKSGSGFGV